MFYIIPHVHIRCTWLYCERLAHGDWALVASHSTPNTYTLMLFYPFLNHYLHFHFCISFLSTFTFSCLPPFVEIAGIRRWEQLSYNHPNQLHGSGVVLITVHWLLLVSLWLLRDFRCIQSTKVYWWGGRSLYTFYMWLYTTISRMYLSIEYKTLLMRSYCTIYRCSWTFYNVLRLSTHDISIYNSP